MPTRQLLPYFLAALFLVLFIHQCDQRQAIERQNEQNVDFLNDSLEQFRNKYGQLVSEKKALKGDKQSLDILLSKQVDSTQQLKKLVADLKDVDFAANVKTITKIDTIKTYFAKPIGYEFARDFSADTDHYLIEGVATQNGVKLNTINIPTQLSLAVGKKKTGWFKSEYQFQATSPNPYVKIQDLQGGTFQSYDSPVSISGQLGYGITPAGLQPYAGIGLSFDALRLIGL